ncbi:MAG: transglycosylase family protein [Rhodospirillales bacterium]|nr:transglycosylase family protein [Rhodospirillales bacterium]
MNNRIAAPFSLLVIALSIGVSLWPSPPTQAGRPPSPRSTLSARSTPWVTPTPSLLSSTESAERSIESALAAQRVDAMLATTLPVLAAARAQQEAQAATAAAAAAAARVQAAVRSQSASTASTATPPVASGDYDHRWDAVAMCEEGGWSLAVYQHGPTYWGNLGISGQNWDTYGAGVDRNNATPAQQVMVAERIQSNPPDQHGCAGW